MPLTATEDWDESVDFQAMKYLLCIKIICNKKVNVSLQGVHSSGP